MFRFPKITGFTDFCKEKLLSGNIVLRQWNTQAQKPHVKRGKNGKNSGIDATAKAARRRIG